MSTSLLEIEHGEQIAKCVMKIDVPDFEVEVEREHWGRSPLSSVEPAEQGQGGMGKALSIVLPLELDLRWTRGLRNHYGRPDRVD